jgi:AraC-like DNA-binding protein
MNTILNPRARARLERSCSASPDDWIRFAVPQAGLQRIEAFFAGHAYDLHRHDTYAVGYTMNGVQSFDYRGSRANSIRGNVIVLHPDEVHDGRAGTSTGFRYRMLYIEPHLIRNALGEKSRSLPFVRNPVLRNPRLMQALWLALDDLVRGLEALQLDQVVLSVAEALLALDTSAADRSRVTTCFTAVERARQFLDAHYDRVVTSEELEVLSGFDRFALARQFRRQFGTSPYRYLTLRRLEHARSMVRAGHSLANSALACGFSDQSHMTRQFKQAYGMSPSRWRAICRTSSSTKARC